MVKPTIAEIAEYCKERGNHVDPEKFYYYYESVGWVVGKKPMKDWQACVHTWERNTTHSMAIKQRDEAVTASKKVLMEQDRALPKSKPNPEIAELNKQMFALEGNRRYATQSQRIQINTKMRAIRKQIIAIKDKDSSLGKIIKTP